MSGLYVGWLRHCWWGLFGLLAGMSGAFAQSCKTQSGEQLASVVELYTSEGCSSCPPADRWLSILRPSDLAGVPVVLQAFHVAYWDYIGWVDRFASPAHTTRQRQLAQWNGLRNIYTPQLLLQGRDWAAWHKAGAALPATRVAAHASIAAEQSAPDRFEAVVHLLASAPPSWGAYWTVTEQGHSSRVQAGENAGEFLRHAHVVRQYTPIGDYRSDPARPQRLTLHAVPATPGHARRINLVVFDSRTGATLQAVTFAC